MHCFFVCNIYFDIGIALVFLGIHMERWKLNVDKSDPDFQYGCRNCYDSDNKHRSIFCRKTVRRDSESPQKGKQGRNSRGNQDMPWKLQKTHVFCDWRIFYRFVFGTAHNHGGWSRFRLVGFCPFKARAHNGAGSRIRRAFGYFGYNRP